MPKKKAVKKTTAKKPAKKKARLDVNQRAFAVLQRITEGESKL